MKSYKEQIRRYGYIENSVTRKTVFTDISANKTTDTSDLLLIKF